MRAVDPFHFITRRKSREDYCHIRTGNGFFRGERKRFIDFIRYPAGSLLHMKSIPYWEIPPEQFQGAQGVDHRTACALITWIFCKLSNERYFGSSFKRQGRHTRFSEGLRLAQPAASPRQGRGFFHITFKWKAAIFFPAENKGKNAPYAGIEASSLKLPFCTMAYDCALCFLPPE